MCLQSDLALVLAWNSFLLSGMMSRGTEVRRNIENFITCFATGRADGGDVQPRYKQNTPERMNWDVRP